MGVYDYLDMARRFREDRGSLSLSEAEALLSAEVDGRVRAGDLPMRAALDRERALGSPYYLATELVDGFYRRYFEHAHAVLLDEVLGPYLLGETVRIEGSSYDPRQYLGLMILWSRGTFKSSALCLASLWDALHAKVRRGFDSRHMYTHQVLLKAIQAGERQRSVARHGVRFRAAFPEFCPGEGQWDTQQQWRWACFESHQAGEWSFTAYGETSDKTGGHYTADFRDDWVTEKSVTTPEQLDQSEANFRAMDNLRDLTRPFVPRVVAGTHYHYQDCYKRIEKSGGYLVWRVPAHTGSPKRIFDVAAIGLRTEKERLRTEVGIQALEREPVGRLNFPTLLPWRVLVRAAMEQGPAIYNTQQLLDPMPEGEQRFDLDALAESWVDEVPGPGEMWLYVRCDPAISVKRDRDETAIHVAGVDWRGWRWFVDGWAGREKRPTEIVRKMFGFARRWLALGYRVQNIGIEAVQYQEALAELCRIGVPEREAWAHGELVPVLKSPCAVRSITRSPDMRKQERILEMDGPVSRREVRVLRSNPVGERFMAQLRNFPFDRDDLLDAAHDMWEGVLVPPRAMVPEARAHRIFRKYLSRRLGRAEEPRLEGTANEAKLAAWG